jgi:predicted transcriptional regulator
MPRRPRRTPLPALSPLEHDVMQVVWASGPSTVETVHAAVSAHRDLKEVTTRTVLRRLEQKGHLTHDVDGRAYLYRAVETPRTIAAQALRQLIDRFCHGSVEELVSGIVDSRVLSEAELTALEQSIAARARAQGRARQKGR